MVASNNFIFAFPSLPLSLSLYLLCSLLLRERENSKALMASRLWEELQVSSFLHKHSPLRQIFPLPSGELESETKLRAFEFAQNGRCRAHSSRWSFPVVAVATATAVIIIGGFGGCVKNHQSTLTGSGRRTVCFACYFTTVCSRRAIALNRQLRASMRKLS